MLVFFVHQPDRVRAAFERRKRMFDKLAHGTNGIVRADRQFALPVADVGIHTFQRGDEQAFLRLEVIIEHVLAALAAIGDPIDPRAFEANPAEFANCRGKNFLSDNGRIRASACHKRLRVVQRHKQIASLA